jgi:hypothetical protein
MRHALAVRARRALSAPLAAGLAYRFYADDWEMLSHTMEAEVSFAPDTPTLFVIRYRLYGQTRAGHYQPRFADRADAGRSFTRDKELSPFTSHRLALDAERSFGFGGLGVARPQTTHSGTSPPPGTRSVRGRDPIGPYLDFPSLREGNPLRNAGSKRRQAIRCRGGSS